jgi:NAD(P)H-flavin reductase
MPLSGVLRLGYVHARVTDLGDARSHYGNTMGLYPVHEEPGRLYYKGWDEFDHHSVVLEEGGVGLVKLGFKVCDAADIDGIEARARAFGCVTERMSKGENLEVGDGLRIVSPSAHVIEIYHQMTQTGSEVGAINPDVFPRHLVGVGAPRIDHALITAADVKTMDRFFHEVLGFYATERVVTSLDEHADYIGTWMTAGNTVHDIAVINGPDGKLHHFAFQLTDWSEIKRAGQLFAVLEADVDVDDDLPVHPVENYAGTILAIEEIAEETRRILVGLDRDLAFNAGQYMSWQLPFAPGVTRTYSMANPPSQARTLEFQVRRTPGGRCTDGWLFRSLAVGDQVTMAGPYGRFVLRPARSEPAVLIAGGTGVAPITSMIRHVLLDGAPAGPMTLYQGARSQAWLHDVDMFRDLAAAYPDRFRYRPCLADELAAGFSAGLVTDVLAADYETLAGHVAYVCGPPGMVEASLRTLMSRRLFLRDIYREEFLDEGDKVTGGLRSPLLRR